MASHLLPPVQALTTEVILTTQAINGPMAREILEYLIRNPGARDTVEGIVEWWLTEQRIQRALAEAHSALEDLVQRDLVIAEKRQDGKTHFRINPVKQKEINDLLKKTGP